LEANTLDLSSLIEEAQELKISIVGQTFVQVCSKIKSAHEAQEPAKFKVTNPSTASVVPSAKVQTRSGSSTGAPVLERKVSAKKAPLGSGRQVIGWVSSTKSKELKFDTVLEVLRSNAPHLDFVQGPADRTLYFQDQRTQRANVKQIVSGIASVPSPHIMLVFVTIYNPAQTSFAFDEDVKLPESVEVLATMDVHAQRGFEFGGREHRLNDAAVAAFVKWVK
jgi:hypothetical protein